MAEYKKIKVKFSMREGEYGPSARIEFPHSLYIFNLLLSTPIEEQKKYKFHYFNNILVAKDNLGSLKTFLQEGAKKFGVEIEFVK